MKVGNKSQALILSFVALGAIGFLFAQIQGAAGRAAKNLRAMATASVGGPGTEATENRLPKSYYGDPFSHPALPRSEQQKPAQSDGESGQSSASEGPPVRGNGLFGSRPLPIGDMIGGSLPDLSTAVVKSEDPQPRKGPNVALQAIVMANAPMAFVAVDGGEPRRFKIGDSPAQGVVIVGIREGAVDFQFSKSRKTLTVGESIQL